ncbi:MAG TPA: 3-phosphoshikimate 1-carboxyvinyltransferase [Nitrospiria bacterium]
MKSIQVKKSQGLRGTISVPGDKSITHRAVIMGSLGRGTTVVRGYLPSDDCIRTAQAFRNLGVAITQEPERLVIEGKGLRGLVEPGNVLDLGNSGTATRLMTGVLSGQDLFAVLTGDESLRSRPMGRVVEPLRKMGARISGRNDGAFAPLAVRGGGLKGIEYRLPVASAQVKSAVLLAGLTASGRTTVVEPMETRDHTERILKGFGVSVEKSDGRVAIDPAEEFSGAEIDIPGDLSSAAFFIVAATVVKNSEITIRQVGVNPTRSGLLDLLIRMGAEIRRENETEVNGEPVADLTVVSRDLKGIEVDSADVPRTIDEFPVFCVAAALAEGRTVVRGAEELRVKESDRIRTMAQELSRFGVPISEYPDGLEISGSETLKGARCASHGDHRVAMAMAVAGLAAEGQTTVEDTEWIETSFPGFEACLERVSK